MKAFVYAVLLGALPSLAGALEEPVMGGPTEPVAPETLRDAPADEVPPPALDEAPTALVPPPAAAAPGRVNRAVFTSAIADREPVDNIISIANDQSKVIFFTELVGMKDRVAKHRWEYNGQVMGEVDFNVRGPRWRVWSSKDLKPTWTGEWIVRVLDEEGAILSEHVFLYTDAGTTTPLLKPGETPPADSVPPAPEPAPAAPDATELEPQEGEPAAGVIEPAAP